MPKTSPRKSSDKKPKLSERKQRIYDFLRVNPAGVLSSVTASDLPHGSTIYYTIDTNFTISFLTKVSTLKYKNLSQNPNVVVTVFEPQTQTTAQICGKATEITDKQEIDILANAIARISQPSDEGSLPDIIEEAEHYVGFRITPDQIHMAVYTRAEPGENRALFESTESYDLKDADS